MEWRNENDRLFKSFEFVDFSSAFAFMTRVALLAEKLDHHPSWKNEYNVVDISLTTHNKGNIVTQKDVQMAAAIDKLSIFK